MQDHPAGRQLAPARGPAGALHARTPGRLVGDPGRGGSRGVDGGAHARCPFLVPGARTTFSFFSDPSRKLMMEKITTSRNTPHAMAAP